MPLSGDREEHHAGSDDRRTDHAPAVDGLVQHDTTEDDTDD